MPPLTLDRLLAGVSNPAAPLITYYDTRSGERIELSTTTTANWVAKTSNFFVEELEFELGTRIRVGLPPHWLRAICVLAAWSVGAELVDEDAQVAITGPELAAEEVVRVAASLLPLGRGFSSPPPGFFDLTTEVLSHSDYFESLDPPTPHSPAVNFGGHAQTHADYLAGVEPDGRRVVLSAPDLATETHAITAALLGSGSLILVAGATHDDLDRIAAQENAVSRQG